MTGLTFLDMLRNLCWDPSKFLVINVEKITDSGENTQIVGKVIQVNIDANYPGDYLVKLNMSGSSNNFMHTDADNVIISTRYMNSLSIINPSSA